MEYSQSRARRIHRLVPPQQRISEEWYRGTADAVYQNLFLLDNDHPEFLLVLAGDHIYKMNYADMYNLLIEKQADAIVGAIETPLADAHRFGVIAVDEDRRILSFDESPRSRCTFRRSDSGLRLHGHLFVSAPMSSAEQLIRDAKEGTSTISAKYHSAHDQAECRVYALQVPGREQKP